MRERQSRSVNALGIPERNTLKSPAAAARRIFVPEMAKVSPSASLLPEDFEQLMLEVLSLGQDWQIDGAKKILERMAGYQQ